MSAKKKKIIELYVYIGISLVYFLSNLFLCRVFHSLLVLFLGAIVLIHLLCVWKRKYIDWDEAKDRPPTGWYIGAPVLVNLAACLIVLLGGCITAVLEYYEASEGIISFLTWFVIFMNTFQIAMMIFLIYRLGAYLIKYNIAYFRARKLIEQKKGAVLYNQSVFVIHLLIILLVFGMTFLVDTCATVKSPSRYVREINALCRDDESFGFFPSSIPDEAEDVEFMCSRKFLVGYSRVYVSYRMPKEYIADIEELYGDSVSPLECKEVVVTEDTTIDGRAVDLFKDYVGKPHCDVYVGGYKNRYGYAINRETNEICFFYDVLVN